MYVYILHYLIFNCT